MTRQHQQLSRMYSLTDTNYCPAFRRHRHTRLCVKLNYIQLNLLQHSPTAWPTHSDPFVLSHSTTAWPTGHVTARLVPRTWQILTYITVPTVFNAHTFSVQENNDWSHIHSALAYGITDCALCKCHGRTRTRTHTHTQPFNGCPGLPRWAGTWRNTIAACFAAISMLCYLFLISVSAPYLQKVCYLNAIHPSDHSHLCSLKCHLIFFPYRPGLTSMQHTVLHTTAIQLSSHTQWYIILVKPWYQLPEYIPANSNSGLHSCISRYIHTPKFPMPWNVTKIMPTETPVYRVKVLTVWPYFHHKDIREDSKQCLPTTPGPLTVSTSPLASVMYQVRVSSWHAKRGWTFSSIDNLP